MEQSLHGPHWRSDLAGAAADEVLALLFDAVLDESETGVVVLDADLRFVLINAAAARLYEAQPEPNLGRTIGDLAPGAAVVLVPLLIEVLRTGEPRVGVEVEIDVESPTGAVEHRWFRATLLRIEVASHPEQRLVAAAFSDITARTVQAQKLAALAELSRRLNRAHTTDEVVQILVGADGRFGGDVFVTVALLDEGSRALRVGVPAAVGPDVLAGWQTMPLGSPIRTPFLDAFETNQAVYVLSPAERAERYPHLAGVAAGMGIEGSVAIPISGADDQPFAVIGVSWEAGLDPAPDGQARLELLTDLCSEALQRARRSDAASELVHHLQAELLAAVDPADGLDVAVGYRPAVGALGFGGDWYDVVAARPGATAIIVGDVVGHGIAAGAQMAQAKGVVRALTITATDLRDVFSDATRSLRHLDMPYVATVGIAVVDRVVGTLSWATAGHLPPVLLDPSGRAELLWGPHQPPIGMTEEAVDVPSRPLVPGSLLVLYTDGLVETRKHSIHERLQDLVTEVEALPRDVDAADARDHLLAAMVGGAAEDDIAIVVARIE